MTDSPLPDEARHIGRHAALDNLLLLVHAQIVSMRAHLDVLTDRVLHQGAGLPMESFEETRLAFDEECRVREAALLNESRRFLDDEGQTDQQAAGRTRGQTLARMA